MNPIRGYKNKKKLTAENQFVLLKIRITKTVLQKTIRDLCIYFQSKI